MDYYFNYGMPPWLAAFSKTFGFLNLERVFLGRHKYHHFRVWFRDQLADYIREILLDNRAMSRPYIVGDRLESMISRHIQGEENYTSQIAQLLTIELFHRAVLDR